MPKPEDYGDWAEFLTPPDDFHDPILSYYNTAETLMDAGFESPADFEGHAAEVFLNDEGWGINIDGEAIVSGLSDEDNWIVWDFYSWWEAYFDEPPDKDIASPGGEQ